MSWVDAICLECKECKPQRAANARLGAAVRMAIGTIDGISVTCLADWAEAQGNLCRREGWLTAAAVMYAIAQALGEEDEDGQ